MAFNPYDLSKMSLSVNQGAQDYMNPYQPEDYYGTSDYAQKLAMTYGFLPQTDVASVAKNPIQAGFYGAGNVLKSIANQQMMKQLMAKDAAAQARQAEATALDQLLKRQLIQSQIAKNLRAPSGGGGRRGGGSSGGDWGDIIL